jgi:Asp-tRNA(Asn)/Glu-tRNA(Gln) amidotransferase A subunit family amidase
MTTELHRLSAFELRALILAKDLSPVELMRATLDRIDALEPELNAFATLMSEQALDDARHAERALMAGEPAGWLHGLPVSVKDLVAVNGAPLMFGSRALEHNVATIDAPAVERLRHAGACIVGKTTTSEFGCKAVGDSALTGITRNPWDVRRTPGGSSCGAAASVAAGMTALALGTDGGGSIRIPAALTGIVGVKAQFGRVPVHPAAATPSLAHVGPLARTVRDAALLLHAISGFDERDPFAIAGPVPDYLAACEREARGMRVAWSRTLGYATPDAAVATVAERAAFALRDCGCEVHEVADVVDDPEALWGAEFYGGVAARVAALAPEQRAVVDPAIAARLDVARTWSSADHHAAVMQRHALRERMRAFFADYELLVTPTLPCTAFEVEHDAPPAFALRGPVSWVFYTYPFNLTGHPAMSVPAGLDPAGLPVGLQLVARTHREIDLFRAAAALEFARPWSHLHPPGF